MFIDCRKIWKMHNTFYFHLPDTWVLVNTTISKLGTLLLEGTLEFQNNPDANYELNADYIIIMGGRLIIGWPDDPFLGLASIILRGNHSSSYYTPVGSGPTIGSKAIGETAFCFLRQDMTLLCLPAANFVVCYMIFANSLDPDQAGQSLGSDLDPNCLTI